MLHCNVAATSDVVLESSSPYFSGLRLHSYRHECKYESKSGLPFTGCLWLVQASPIRMERSWSLVQAH